MNIRRACRLLSLGGVLVSLSACGQMRDLLAGPGYDIDPTKVQTYAKEQTAVVDAVSEMAGLEVAPRTQEEWRRFVIAGIQYSDRQCEAYMNALFWFHRGKSRTTQQLTLASAATLAIMGTVNATVQALAITGVAFGLVGATVENVGSGLLYELDPAAVRELVRKLQQHYEANLPPGGYKDRSGAFRALQGYIALCLPASIETQVANSVKIAKPDGASGNADTGTPPVSQIGPLLVANYGEDQNSALLKAFLYDADGKLNAARNTQLLGEMKKVGVDGPSSVMFIIAAQFKEQRAKVVTALKLK